VAQGVQQFMFGIVRWFGGRIALGIKPRRVIVIDRRGARLAIVIKFV
jgi:hypothetical protein